jgi:prevent-host-death family protein
MRDMEHRISATELARHLGDVLGRVRYRNDTFVVERNGDAVARVVPVAEATPTTVLEAFTAWRAAGPPDAAFAEDLDQVSALDLPPPVDPWAS